MITKLEVEALAGGRDGFTFDPDLIADEQAFDVPVAVIFDNVRPQVVAILAIDNGAARRASIAFVGNDQFQRLTEQFDMFVIDLGNGGDTAPQQTNRVIAAADAGLEHHEFAIALLEVAACQRKHRLEGAELFAAFL